MQHLYICLHLRHALWQVSTTRCQLMYLLQKKIQSSKAVKNECCRMQCLLAEVNCFELKWAARRCTDLLMNVRKPVWCCIWHTHRPSAVASEIAYRQSVCTELGVLTKVLLPIHDQDTFLAISRSSLWGYDAHLVVLQYSLWRYAWGASHQFKLSDVECPMLAFRKICGVVRTEAVYMWWLQMSENYRASLWQKAHHPLQSNSH